ncbi:hypothetical protein NNC19_12930 [Clostridium sp. SHJSY1]|uniref:hypothetical protein n=1 Tax=Clostridium sp. SHJSY1 TaxID=2942483 RepID=UPI0028752ECF|nr:hypothetical protein [Clostridium sp. SHJSY1]MDS0526589.1 hypothetical protein [Clostridium sp. SHJSY1]
MGELSIKTHDFESSKNQLKVFSEQTPTDLELHKVDIRGGFLGLGDHKVTGYELNSLTTQIQDYLIDFNSLHTKFLKEFGQVYNALEALDKDYIQAILIAIKAAEKANNEVKVAQSDITKTIELQKKIITVLKQFKEKVESYKHLEDIDKMWSDSQRLQKDIKTISSNVDAATVSIKGNTQELKSLNKFKEQIEKIKHIKNIDELWNDSQYLKKEILSIDDKIDNIIVSLENQLQTLDTLTRFKEKIESYEHLGDVDKLWDASLKIREEISSINNDIKNINASAKNQIQAIETLNQFKTTLEECEHLKDIDMLWNQSESFRKEISGINKKLDDTVISIESQAQSIGSLKQFKDRLDGYEHLGDIDETWNKFNDFEVYITSTKDIVNTHEEQIYVLKNCLQEMQKQNDERSQMFSKKLKISYALAGSSIGIAIIEFVLLMLRII